MRRVLWGGLLWVVACRGGGSSAANPPARLPCKPTLHETSGPLSKEFLEQYRFVGGSADGKREAVIWGSIGPGSGVPVVSIAVLEAGSPSTVFKKTYFVNDAPADQMNQIIEGVLPKHEGDLVANGVTVGKGAPAAVAWCADGEGKIHTASGQTLSLRVGHEACPEDAKKLKASWQLCLEGKAGACIATTRSDCLDGTAALLDLYRAGPYTWVVVNQVIEPFSGVKKHSQWVVGGELLAGKP